MLKITYELTGYGWAECTIIHNEKKIVVTASALGDAFSELLEATHKILEKNWQAKVRFEEEPGQFRWVLQGNFSHVKIKIFWFDDLWSKETEDKDQLVFSTTCTMNEFKVAMISCFSRVARKYHPKVYKNKWGFPFPTKRYEEPRRKYG